MALIVGLLIFMVIRPQSQSILLVGLTATLAASLGATFAFLPYRRPQAEGIPVVRLASATPLLFGIAALSLVIGYGTWVIGTLLAQTTVAYSIIAHLFFLFAYPFILAGILRLPRIGLPDFTRWRIVLDSLILVIVGFTVIWYFLVGPEILASRISQISKVATLTYPFCDLLFLCCLMLLNLRIRKSVLNAASGAVGMALGTLVLSDVAFSSEVLSRSYVPGHLLDLGWPLAAVFLGIAARSVQAIPAGVLPDEEAPVLVAQPLWRILLPYVPMTILASLLVMTWKLHILPPLLAGVGLGTVSLGVLSFLRQLLVLLDNQRLFTNAVRINEQLSEANSRLEALSTTDPLTGLPNHRALNAAFDHEIERSHRYSRSFAVLFIDLDHFKAINDAYGHPIGDAILREVGQTLRAALRRSDVVGRWGGEEFVAFLPEANAVEMQKIGEDVRQAVASHQFALAGGHVSCSIGCALFPIDARTRDGLLRSADQALYVSKRLGRNQVRSAADPAVRALANSDVTSPSREDAAMVGTIEALAAIVDARDRYTGAHMHDVARLALEIAVALGVGSAEARMLSFAAEVHDVGKVAVPDSILRKAGMLNAAEWEQVCRHPGVGAEVIGHIPGLATLVPIVLSHHERWDGTGYPHGLAGTAIPLGARIIAVADAYSAMITDRPYHRAVTPSEALAEVRRCSGSQFDPAVAEALAKVLATNPDMFGVPWTSRSGLRAGEGRSEGFVSA